MGSPTWAHETVFFRPGAARLLDHLLLATSYGYLLLAIENWVLVVANGLLAIGYLLLTLAIGY
jgi:hypothetical protein